MPEESSATVEALVARGLLRWVDDVTADGSECVVARATTAGLLAYRCHVATQPGGV